MSGSVLSIGECMVELAQTGPDTYRRGFAGDTFNTAWYARRLLPPEWNVSYGTCVGHDAVSDEMLAFMRDACPEALPRDRVELDRLRGEAAEPPSEPTGPA